MKELLIKQKVNDNPNPNYNNYYFQSDEFLKNRQDNSFRLKKEKENNLYFLSSKPSAITIEPGAICQLKCVLCPQWKDTFNFSKEFLKLSQFIELIELFKSTVEHINLYNWGEPLLNPDLPDMIKYSNKYNIDLTIHSNMNYLTPKLAEELITSGPFNLSVSIDAASEKSYKLYQVGGSFDKAITNLKILLKIKKQLKTASPNIKWQFLVFRHNEHEIDKAKRLAEEIGVVIKIAYAESKDKLEPDNPKYNMENFHEKFVKEHGRLCDELWRGPVIHSNGEILPCCMIKDIKYSLGNVFEKDFNKIWNSEKYQKYRQYVSGENVCEDDDLFCKKCVLNPRLNNAKKTEEFIC